VWTAHAKLAYYVSEGERVAYVKSMEPQFLALPGVPSKVFLAGAFEVGARALVEGLYRNELSTLGQLREAAAADARERAVDEFGNQRRQVEAAAGTVERAAPDPSFEVLSPLPEFPTMAAELAAYVASCAGVGEGRSDIGPARFAAHLRSAANSLAPPPPPRPPRPPRPPPVPAPAPSTSPAPALPASAYYRCRSCRHPLFLPSALVPHPSCSSPPFVPPPALEPPFDPLSGPLACPKCKKQYGSYNHAGLKCGCNRFLSEGFIFVLSKVDHPPKAAVGGGGGGTGGAAGGGLLQVTRPVQPAPAASWKGVTPKGAPHELQEQYNKGGTRRARSKPKAKHIPANQLYDNK
jgi:hypothetical protein